MVFLKKYLNTQPDWIYMPYYNFWWKTFLTSKNKDTDPVIINQNQKCNTSTIQ